MDRCISASWRSRGVHRRNSAPHTPGVAWASARTSITPHVRSLREGHLLASKYPMMRVRRVSQQAVPSGCERADFGLTITCRRRTSVHTLLRSLPVLVCCAGFRQKLDLKPPVPRLFQEPTRSMALEPYPETRALNSEGVRRSWRRA